MSLIGLVILTVLVLILFGALPQMGWHKQGYAPSGLLTVVVVVLLILLLLGRI